MAGITSFIGKALTSAKAMTSELRNVRRRFTRAAARYERQAETATTEDAQILLAAARQARKLAGRYMVKGLTGKRSLNLLTDEEAGTFKESFRKAVESSLNQLAGRQNVNLRDSAISLEQQNVLAKTILSSGRKGNAFYAAFKDVWYKQEGDRDQLIIDFLRNKGYKVDSLLDAVRIYDTETGAGVFDEREYLEDEKYLENSRAGMLFVSNLEREK